MPKRKVKKRKGGGYVVGSVVLIWILWVVSAHAFDLTSPTSQEETITVSNSAIGITASICTKTGGNGRTKALMQVKTEPIYFSVHSASATPDSGDFKANDGDMFTLSQTEVAKLRMIRVGSDASVKVQCFSD